MNDSAPPSSRPPSMWRRYLAIGAALIVIVAAVSILWWPSIRFGLWIGELHSDSPAVNKGAREKLIASQDPEMNDRLFEVLVDPDRSFPVRRQVGDVLIARNRMGLVEKALQVPDPAGRIAALGVLHGQSGRYRPDWFRTTYLERAEYPIRETLEAWLGRDGDVSRREAIEIVSSLGLEELVPLIRPLAAIPRDRGLGSAEQQVIVAAARALLRFRDCASVPGFVEPARAASEDLVRLRMVRVLYDAVIGPEPKCPDAVPRDVVKEVVLQALEDGQSNTRHGSLLILQREPTWVSEVEDRLLAIVDGQTQDTVYLRRAALDALGASGTVDFARRLPRYFHADADVVRSTAVDTSLQYAKREDAPLRYESCWIGLLERETGSEPAYRQATTALHASADRWVGLPEDLDERAAGGREKVETFRKEMFEKGESHGLDRLAWAERWFRWWAAELGLTEKAADDALGIRRAFWKAAARGDVDAARAALEEFASPTPDLFLYEQGWLDGHAP